MKFRKKPVVIEAEQFFYHHRPWPEGVQLDDDYTGAIVETDRGWCVVIEGDWIITGVKGERYPCKPDIFDLTYEAVTS